MGLSGNLTTGEILEQIVHADRILAREWEDLKRQADGTRNIPKLDLVRNVVFMGMGEVRTKKQKQPTLVWPFSLDGVCFGCWNFFNLTFVAVVVPCSR